MIKNNRERIRIEIRLTKEEKEQIEQKSKMINLTTSAYLRNLGLGYPLQSKVDQLALSELMKIHTDFGRLGGLLKMWLSNTKDEWDPRLGDKNRFKVELLVKEIEQDKKEILEIAKRLLNKTSI
jgi:hypothetical protein